MTRAEILKILGLEILSDVDISNAPVNEKIILADTAGYKYFLSINNLRSFLKRLKKNSSSELARFYRGNIFTEENIKLFIKKSGKQLHPKNSVGKTATEKFVLVCEKHRNEFLMTWNALKNGQGCPMCGVEKRVKKKTHTIEWVKHEALNRFAINIISENYESNLTRLNFYCLKHPDFLQTKSWAQMIEKSHPCSRCAKEILKEKYKNCRSTTACPKNPQIFLEQMKEIYGDKYEFLEEYKLSTTKIKVKCNNCERIFYAAPYHLLEGHGCGCARSRGEEKIKLYLQRNQFAYIEQKRFKNCKDKKTLSYDFFVPKHNLLIEFQGRQHYFPTEKFGGENSFKKQKRHDLIKKNYAKNHNFNFLEISYFDYNKIDDILNKFFKLEGVF